MPIRGITLLLSGAVVISGWAAHQWAGLKVHQVAEAGFVNISGQAIAVANDAIHPKPFLVSLERGEFGGVIPAWQVGFELLYIKAIAAWNPLPVSEYHVRAVIRFIGRVFPKFQQGNYRD